MKKIIFLIWIAYTCFYKVNAQVITNHTVQINNPLACCCGTIGIDSVYSCPVGAAITCALMTPTSSTPFSGQCSWGNLCNGIYTISINFISGSPTATMYPCNTFVCTAGYLFTTGLKENNQDAFFISLFPNPVSDFLNIAIETTSTDDKINIAIYDCTGRFMREEYHKLSSKTAAIDTKDLPAGIYFLHFQSDDGEKIKKKFVIAR